MRDTMLTRTVFGRLIERHSKEASGVGQCSENLSPRTGWKLSFPLHILVNICSGFGSIDLQVVQSLG